MVVTDQPDDHGAIPAMAAVQDARHLAIIGHKRIRLIDQQRGLDHIDGAEDGRRRQICRMQRSDSQRPEKE